MTLNFILALFNAAPTSVWLLVWGAALLTIGAAIRRVGRARPSDLKGRPATAARPRRLGRLVPSTQAADRV